MKEDGTPEFDDIRHTKSLGDCLRKHVKERLLKDSTKWSNQAANLLGYAARIIELQEKRIHALSRGEPDPMRLPRLK